MRNLWMFGITGLGLCLNACIFDPKEEPITPEEGEWELVISEAAVSGDCDLAAEDFIGESLELILERSDEGDLSIIIEELKMEASQEENVLKASGEEVEDLSVEEPQDSEEPQDAEEPQQDNPEPEESEEESEGEENSELEQGDQGVEEEPMTIAVDFEGNLIAANEMEGKLLIQMTQAEQLCSLDFDFTAAKVDPATEVDGEESEGSEGSEGEEGEEEEPSEGGEISQESEDSE